MTTDRIEPLEVSFSDQAYIDLSDYVGRLIWGERVDDPGVWCFTMHGTVWVSTRLARLWDETCQISGLVYAPQPPLFALMGS